MANNPYLLNAALSGISGGNMERWLTSINPVTYTNFSNAALTLATAIDAQIPTISNGATTEDGQLIQSIIQGVIAGRNIVSLVSADYTSIAQACAVLFAQVKTKFDASGTPKGTGATPANSFQVDANTVALWKFDNVAGGAPALIDSGPNGLDLSALTGTPRFTSVLPGLRGIVFDGSQRVGRAGHDAALTISGPLTIETIVQFQPLLPFAAAWMFGMTAVGAAEADNVQFQIGQNTPVLVFSWETGLGVARNVISASTPPFSRPCHILCTRHADGSAEIYQDGQTIATLAAGAIATGGTTTTFTVGQFLTGTQPFAGAMAGIKISNIDVSAAQALSRYNFLLGGVYGVRS